MFRGNDSLFFKSLQRPVDEDVALLCYLEVAQVALGDVQRTDAKLACEGDDGLRLPDAALRGEPHHLREGSKGESGSDSPSAHPPSLPPLSKLPCVPMKQTCLEIRWAKVSLITESFRWESDGWRASPVAQR